MGGAGALGYLVYAYTRDLPDLSAFERLRLTATTTKGVPYENDYVWVYTCRDGKICQLDEYVDSFKAAKIFVMAK